MQLLLLHLYVLTREIATKIISKQLKKQSETTKNKKKKLEGPLILRNGSWCVDLRNSDSLNFHKITELSAPPLTKCVSSGESAKVFTLPKCPMFAKNI